MYIHVGPTRSVNVSATARALNITEDPERIPGLRKKVIVRNDSISLSATVD